MVVSKLDVVHEIDAHQSNLTPANYPNDLVIIALPPLPILKFLGGDKFLEHRQEEIRQHASELGLGDQPVPVHSFKSQGDTIEGFLGYCDEQGVSKIFVYGHRSQPDLWRAIYCRWSGGLISLEDHVTTQTLESFEQTKNPTATSIAPPNPQLGRWSGMFPKEALLACESKLRLEWLQRWHGSEIEEECQNGFLGIAANLEEQLAPSVEAEKSSPKHCPPIFAMAGLDGSGKSTHAKALAEEITKRGSSAQVLKLYRHGAFLELADELSARTRSGAFLANFRLSRVTKLLDSLRVLEAYILQDPPLARYLVMDRYIETHHAAAFSQLSWDIRNHPFTRFFPEPARCFWLDLPVESALDRLSERTLALSADEHPVGLKGYAQAYEVILSDSKAVRLDALAPFEENAKKIADAVQTPDKSNIATVSPEKYEAPSRISQTKVSVHIGGISAPALGWSIFDLRDRLANHYPEQLLKRVPEVLWVEAYAIQLILDIGTKAIDVASIPVWPSVLYEMSAFRDVYSLSELTKLLTHHVKVKSCRPDAAREFFSRLTSNSAASERLFEEYCKALKKLSVENAWPWQRHQ